MWCIIVVVLSSVNNLKMSIPGSGLQCIVVLMLRMMNLSMHIVVHYVILVGRLINRYVLLL